MTSEQIITWAITYFIINGFVAVGFLMLARFIRKYDSPTNGREEDTTEDTARRLFKGVLISIGISILFCGKFLWAIMSGVNLTTHRRYSWEWVTKDVQSHKYWITTVLDAGFAIICLVGFFIFLAVRTLELNQCLDPIRKMELKLRWLFLLFWLFVLTIEICIFLGYGVLV